MKVYIGHPISGLPFDYIVEYFTKTAKILEEIWFDVLQNI